MQRFDQRHAFEGITYRMCNGVPRYHPPKESGDDSSVNFTCRRLIKLEVFERIWLDDVRAGAKRDLVNLARAFWARFLSVRVNGT